MPRYSRIALTLAPAAYLLFCLILAALLAHPLLLLMNGRADLHDLVGRGTEVLLVIGLLPLCRKLAIKRADLGLDLAAMPFLLKLAKGFGLGAGMLALHMLLLIAFHIRIILPERLEYSRIMTVLPTALLIGLIVGLVEETVFRGVLVGSLRRRSGVFLAVAVSSTYFAGLHFLHSDLRPPPEASGWFTGLTLVFDAIGNLAGIKPDSFLALLMGGIFLACIRLRNPATSLPMCIGIHAGWVFIIKACKPFTKRTLDPFWSRFASDLDGVIGYLSAAWLSALILLMLLMFRKAEATE